MLPFFFRHYDSIVSRYVFFDDGSTDQTLNIFESHPKVEVRPFVREHKDSYVLSEKLCHNSAWKESRHECDWVIITDIDEHLWNPSLLNYLDQQKAEGVSVIPSLGFQMVCEQFPEKSSKLSDSITSGAPFVAMNKLSIFDPNAIKETNFSNGRHSANPRGKVIFPEKDELLLLHYKYLGLEYVRSRHALLRTGHGVKDIAEGWGHRHRFSDEELIEDFKMFKKQSIDVRSVSFNPDRDHSVMRWWRS